MYIQNLYDCALPKVMYHSFFSISLLISHLLINYCHIQDHVILKTASHEYFQIRLIVAFNISSTEINSELNMHFTFDLLNTKKYISKSNCFILTWKITILLGLTLYIDPLIELRIASNIELVFTNVKRPSPYRNMKHP